MLKMLLLILRSCATTALIPITEKGKHEARRFREKLGVTASDAERLRQLILDAILKIDAIEQKSSQYGRRFTVDFELSWPEGKFIMSNALVRTAWIIRNDEDFPRLTTCFAPRGSA